MTWLSPQFATGTDVRATEPKKIDDEVAPGVIFERRTVLQVSALTAASMLFGGQELNADTFEQPDGRAVNVPYEEDRISWEQFLEMCVPLASRLYEKKSAQGQDEYLFSLAAKAVLIDDVSPMKMKSWRNFDPKYEFELAHQAFPFIVIHWRMEPHAILPAHCHPGTSVCTAGLEGEALVRHFEPADNSAPDYREQNKPFLIRETRKQLVTPKRISTLSETRDNIHYFVAGNNGARGIDITTHYQSDGSVSFLKFDADKPANVREGLYEAVWVGSDVQNNF